MAMRTVLSIAALFSLSAMGSGCTNSPSATCADIESKDYPALRTLATETLAGAPEFHLVNISTCEDTGEPQAFVSARIPAWRLREEAMDALQREAGVRFIDGVGRTRDDAHLVYVARATDESGTYIDVRFTNAPA